MYKLSIQEQIIGNSFFLAVKVIRFFVGSDSQKMQLKELEKYAKGTVGKAIADCLNQNNLAFVPHFENHDLKHVLLNFKMTPLDEIRLQAFMIGNGNLSIPSVAIFIFGFILMPGQWKLFYRDFKRGKKALPIKSWMIDQYAEKKLSELRQFIYNGKTKESFLAAEMIIRLINILIIGVGVFGMLFCLPYLWSSNLTDLIGAGLPFIAGAILTTGGLINLTILLKKKQQRQMLIQP